MPPAPLLFRPGINKQFTPLLNEGGFSDGNLVRFRDQLAEKMKGWVNVAVGKTFIGVCRALLSWTQISGVKNAALGTSLKLMIFQGGEYYDITPVDVAGGLGNNPFATVNGSAIVTVTHGAHGRSETDRVIYAGAVAFNGVTIAGEKTVATVIDPDTYTIEHTAAATGTGSGGGSAVTFTYLLSSGPVSALPGFGWGAGTWGESTWGTARTVALGVAGPRLWSLDLVGEDLLACPRDGKIFTWDASSGVNTRAVALANAPNINRSVMMSAPERHVVSLGAEIGSVQDPMLVRWTDTEIFTVWTATATNTAGSFRLSDGSEIVISKASTREILIWTDTSLHAMRWQGAPFVFRFDKIGAGCGLMGPNAAAVHDGVAFWISNNKQFYRYRGGSPEVIPCPVWDEVFENLNLLQRHKVCAGMNSANNGVIWHYPSSASDENDRYAEYNFGNDTWVTGFGMPRTAWHAGEIFGAPIATHSSNGKMFYHETGEDDDGAPMQWFIETGDVDLEEGDYFMATSDFFPDFKMTGPGATVDVSLLMRDEPDGDRTVVGPVPVTTATKIIDMRGRGRHGALRIQGGTLGMSWRWGKPRLRTQRDGLA